MWIYTEKYKCMIYQHLIYLINYKVHLNFVKNLYNEYGILYKNPVYTLEKKEIKYGLFDRGMTIQPLEDTCLFSNTFSTASDEVIEQYLRDKKQLCNELIERGLSYEKNR